MIEEKEFILFKEKNLQKLLSLFSLLGCIIGLGYLPLDFMQNYNNIGILVTLRLLSSAVIIIFSILVFFCKENAEIIRKIPFLLCLSITIFSALITHFVGAFKTNYLYGYLEVIVTWCVIFPQKPKVTIITSIILILIFNLIICFLNFSDLLQNAFQLIEFNMILLGTTTLAVISSRVGYQYKYNTYIAQKETKEEKKKVEKLLLNILPITISERLKNGETTISDYFENVAVLFADLAGFTKYCSGKSSKEIVEVLNEIFSAFDDKVEELNLEKIKTIGDGYMVLAGGLKGNNCELLKTIELGEYMIDYITKFSNEKKIDLSIRIGIHIGDATAGVIGKTKFAFDIWGDTVNIASRMESSGIPMEIHVTEEVVKLINDKTKCKSRGEIEVKGKGIIKTYIVNR